MEQTYEAIKQSLFNAMGLDPDNSIEYEITQGDGLTIDFDGQRAVLSVCDKNAFTRGLFLTEKARAAKEPLHLSQRRHFDSCGVMIDMSRNGVMTVEAIKRVLDMMACLGLNMLQLYTEDTYTVPEYPYFGHMRGRYTPAELKTIDDYAYSFGIEVIPCIQTLGHHGQFLQWAESTELKDQPTVLLCDNEAVYAFIEAEIKAVRACFRSSRIHIGMDEAQGIGLGRYFEQHGLVDRFELLNRHLRRVVDICTKYDFKPMMWSDMFFRIANTEDFYYTKNPHIPDEVIARIPSEVQLCYWDYYNQQDILDPMMAEHVRVKPAPAFAGGIWTWSGFLPQIDRTWATSIPALECCLKNNVDTVFATMWGDDGAETPYLTAMSLLPLYSETCWQGAVPDKKLVQALGEAITGLPSDAFDAFKYFYQGAQDNRNGKGYIYCDLLFPLLENEYPPEACAKNYQKGLRIEEKYPDLIECAYASALYKAAYHRARLIPKLRAAYHAGDKPALKRIANTDIEQLRDDMQNLMMAHRAIWRENFKRCGWENMALRYGAVMGRLADVQITLLEYLAGDLPLIEELEMPPLPSKRKGGMQFYQVYVKPQM